MQGDDFQVMQNGDSGGLTVANIALVVDETAFYFERPLNSRESFPLYLMTEDSELEVFNNDGSLTTEFQHFISNRG